MKKIKKSYLIIFILLVLSIICFGASYAIFMNTSEYHGKLNIVAGDLTYKVESDSLVDHKIVVAANEIKEIDIHLTSLNKISSKYELYYTLNQDDSSVRVGYDVDTKNAVLGTIDANSTKTITIVIRNESDHSTTVTFSVIGGLVNNDLVLTEGKSLNQVVGKYTAYSIGEAITLIDGSKWHVLEESSEIDGMITLLSDYNLNSDGSYNTNCSGIDGDEPSFWCSPMAFDSDGTNSYDESDANNVGYFIKNIYAPRVSSSLPNTTNITLPTAEQLANADGKVFSQSPLDLTSSWLLTTNYWTQSSTSTSSNVWFISGNTVTAGGLRGNNTSTSLWYGVRPVITTLKTNLLAQ